MGSEDPLPVDRVREALKPYGIEVRELEADTSTAVSAAEALGTTVPAIVKSLLFFVGQEPVLVLAPGDRKVDRAALARILGADRARLAKPEEALRVTGYAVGGVPPLGHRSRLRVVMDRGIFENPVVYAAAGAGNALFAVEPSRLQALTDGQVEDVTQSP